MAYHSILVQGCGPFEEDLWESFTISNLHFHGVKLCSRCKVGLMSHFLRVRMSDVRKPVISMNKFASVQVTTIDQDTAQQTGQPLATLQTFRAGKYMPLSKSKGQVLKVKISCIVVCGTCKNFWKSFSPGYCSVRRRTPMFSGFWEVCGFAISNRKQVF